MTGHKQLNKGYLNFFLFLFSPLVILLITNCGSGSRVISTQDKERLAEIMGRDFWDFQPIYAFPQMSNAYVRGASELMARAGSSLSQINLTGADYFMRLDADSIHAYLPYFGEWDNFYEAGSAGSIELNTTIRNFHKEVRKHQVKLKFEARRKVERFNITLEIDLHKKGKLLILSGQRDPIRYEGIVVLKE